MQYILTEEDIKNFNLLGSTAGDIATDADLEAMGKLTAEDIETAPAVTPSQTTLDYTAARAQGVPPESAPQSGGFPSTANPAAVAGAGVMGGVNAGMASLLSQPIPQDPFENLSRSQRMMLGFSALQDAGMALQGKEGGAFDATMAGFRERADMERKRQAAVANQQMMAQIIGPEGSLAAGGMKTAEDYRNAAANLARQMVMMGPAGQNLIPLIQRYEAEAKRLSDLELGETSSVQSAADAFETVADLRRTVEDEDGVTGFWGMMLSKLPWSKAAEVRIDADTLRSNMALDALKALKAQNATLGSVSEAELKLLESEIAQLNFNQNKKAVLKDLDKIEKRYQRAIQSAYANTNRPEELDKIMTSVFGSVPEWSKGSFVQYTFENVPQGEIAFDNGVAYVYRGGDRNDASSWEELK